jgi:hypothetical protein
MERPIDGSGRAGAQRLLVALILLPGLLIAGLAGRDALLTRALQGRIIARRESLDGLGGLLHMVRAREDLLNAEIALVSQLRRTPDPTPDWERVLASVPPEATSGRVVFCSEGSAVTIHGRRSDEALLARVASELEANTDIQRVEISGQGTDDVVLTVAPKPLPSSEDVPP